MNGNGRPSPPSVISRPEYLNLVARYYIRAIRQVTQVKHDAQAEAELAGSAVPSGHVPLSVAQQQQIRISCAAFWTVLEYAPQYNVPEVEIGQIIHQIDERMNAERAQGGDKQGVARSFGVERATVQQVTAAGMQGSPAGGSGVGESSGFASYGAHDHRSISGEQDAPIRRPIPRPFSEAAFSSRNIASTSQISPATTTVSPSSPTATTTSPFIGAKHAIPTPPTTASPNAGIAHPHPLQNGCLSPNEFSALAGAVVPTQQQVEDNRRRRSSDAQSRRSSGTYTRRESGLAGALVPVHQGLASSAQENRMRWSPIQPSIVPYASSPTIQTSGYSIPAVSPLQSSVTSFASPTPPIGSAISPTMSAPGRFASPVSSTASSTIWTGPNPSASTNAPEAVSKDTVNSVRQEASLQRVVNTSPVSRSNARPSPTSFANPPANLASESSKAGPRMIRVNSNGRVSARTPGSTTKSSRTTSITFNAATFARVSAFETAKRLYVEQQRAAAAEEEAIESATAETDTRPTASASPNIDKERSSGPADEVALKKDGPTEVHDVEEPMTRPDSCPNTATPATSKEGTRRLSPVMTTNHGKPALKPIVTGSTDVSQSLTGEEPTGVRDDSNNMSPGKAPFSTETQVAIEVLNPRSTLGFAHAPAPSPTVTESASAIPSLSFEFKPPAKPIPSLPDWLSGNNKKEKQKESRSLLPDWANGSVRQTARPAASIENPSKRRRLETGPLWYNEKAESTKRPSEIIDLTEDLLSFSPSPVVTTTQEVLKVVPSDPVKSPRMPVTVTPAVSLGRGNSFSDSAKPDNSQTPVAPTVTRPSIANLLSDSTGTVATMRARPVVSNSAEAAVDGMPSAVEAGASTSTLQGKDVLDLDFEMQDVTVTGHEDHRSKAPTLSRLLNKEAGPVDDTGSSMHERGNGSSETNMLTGKGVATTLSRTEHLSDNSENLKRRGRPPSTMPPALHPIPAEPTFEDLIQWQRKVWRACFCDWSRCGAVLDNWEALEKHVGLVHIQRQRPRSKPKGNISPTGIGMSSNAGLVHPRQRLIRAESGILNGRRSSSENDDSDPIALLSANSTARTDAIRSTIGPPAVSDPFGEPRDMNELQPERVWLPYICRYGTCSNKDAADVAFATREALHRHVYSHHLDMGSNKGFNTCVVKDCPYTFSEGFNTLAQSHRHIRLHPSSALAQMQHADDLRGTAPSAPPLPLTDDVVPSYLVSCPPIRNGHKAAVDVMIRALAEEQTLWDSEHDMSFRTAFGFVPSTHSDPELEGGPIPPYDMHAKDSPSSTRSVFSEPPEYTLCTPRHPASHHSWTRRPVTMSLAPKRHREMIVTPWCNLSESEREEDEKVRIVMERDFEKAVKDQERLAPRRVALEDRMRIPEGSQREWPMRGTIGPGYYLAE